MATNSQNTRLRFAFRGIIQGVGFRPTVYRCAVSLGLTGFVRNQRSEVIAEIQGPARVAEQFRSLLESSLPAAACIESIDCSIVPLRQENEFLILESRVSEYSFPPIPPDLAICPDCRAELFNPADRRYLYPFITCTQCGPRYSIVEDTPFDRDTTSMIDFPQCPECLAEYRNPRDRRFHSQTNSCPSCGPTLVLEAAGGAPVAGDPLQQAVQALEQGKIVAIQGIGGFHLAADPRRDQAMRRLRSDKEREGKPFALMAVDCEEIARICRVAREEPALQELASPATPIIIFPAAGDAPGHLRGVSHTGTLGVMLPYTPLHLLLFRHPQVRISYRHLVMTSGNLKGEPIITQPAEALAKLSGTADLFLYNNRRILFRSDDSVKRPGSIFLRRSRGYVPRLITLSAPLQQTVLAAGGDLKNAPALGRGADVYLAPYIGDLEDPSTRSDFERQIRKILSLYQVRPERLVFDLHPLYHSTRWAMAQEVPEKIGVQHHHAHLLSVMAEHGLEEAIGLSFDGTGYGSDGTIWGGEFLLARRNGFRRLGCFKPFGLPGGEAAVLHPLRTALSLLAKQMAEEELERIFCAGRGLPVADLALLLEMLGGGLNCPLTSSLGRIFDAAAALLGLVERVSYEGEGPIRLEGLALQAYRGQPLLRGTGSDLAPLRVEQEQGSFFSLDAGPLIAALARGATGKRQAGGAARPPELLAFEFHRAVALGALEGARNLAALSGLKAIALSGGVFQNELLLRLLRPALLEDGFQVFTNRQVPPGDGGIALGQVYFLPENR